MDIVSMNYQFRKKPKRKMKMFDQDRLHELISAIQKSIRWCEVNASRYFARELMDMGVPNAVFGQLRIIAAEDIGLADPSMVGYISECLDNFDELIKQNGVEKKDAKNVPKLCEIIDRAVIAEAISYKSRLLDMAAFATLFNIYKNEKFTKNMFQYLKLFLDALEKEDEQDALYYAFIVDKIIGEKGKLLKVIRDKSSRRNGDLIHEWIDEYEKHKKLLNLTGSIVLLCRDFDFTHGEYKNAVGQQLSIPIKAARIPDRAYDKHTREGKIKGRGLKYFFDVSGNIYQFRKALSEQNNIREDEFGLILRLELRYNEPGSNKIIKESLYYLITRNSTIDPYKYYLVNLLDNQIHNSRFHQHIRKIDDDYYHRLNE